MSDIKGIGTGHPFNWKPGTPTEPGTPQTAAGRHGTSGAYNRGCRCTECVDYRRAYDRARYDRLFSVKGRIAREAYESGRAARDAEIRAAVEEQLQFLRADIKPNVFGSYGPGTVRFMQGRIDALEHIVLAILDSPETT